MAPESAPAGLPQPGATSLQSKRMSITNIGRRSLLQEQGPPELPAPLLPVPFAAEAPMTAPGGMPQPGPQFQALPDLPEPLMPEPFAAQAPMSAPGMSH